MKDNIREYQGIMPVLASDCYIDPSAIIIGKVDIGHEASIWCNAVLRGDVSYIKIGARTNIQDLTMLHVTHYHPEYSQEVPLTIGSDVTVGHNCCLHACTIHDNVLVGMGSTILDGSIVESDVLIGAGSLVPPNKILASGYLYLGNPLKQIRMLNKEEIEYIRYSAEHYVRVMRTHQKHHSS